MTFNFKCDKCGTRAGVDLAENLPDFETPRYDGRTGFVTWVAKDSDTDIGCWLMFYDFKNSTVVVPMQ